MFRLLNWQIVDIPCHLDVTPRWKNFCPAVYAFTWTNNCGDTNLLASSRHLQCGMAVLLYIVLHISDQICIHQLLFYIFNGRWVLLNSCCLGAPGVTKAITYYMYNMVSYVCFFVMCLRTIGGAVNDTHFCVNQLWCHSNDRHHVMSSDHPWLCMVKILYPKSGCARLIESVKTMSMLKESTEILW